MYCSDREHLIVRYETASRQHARAVLSLSEKRTLEFEIAYLDTERLRVVRRLQGHIGPA